jgi:hypothetical protein
MVRCKTALLHGKCFSKRTGPEDIELRLGRDDVVTQRLREPYANRGGFARIRVGHTGRDEAAGSVMVGNFAHAMLE